jgi:hypothetical protein
MLPVTGWLERRRPPDKADLVKRRLLSVLSEAVRCAGLDIPEYAGGTVAQVTGEPTLGATRTATLVVTAKAFAAELLRWADDIEAEDETMAPPTDDSAFRPASESLDSTRFKTYKQLHAALKANPWIRTRKPSPQRLEIHAGDWQRFRNALDTAGFESLDVSAETAEGFMAEVRERQEEIRQRKAGK